MEPDDRSRLKRPFIADDESEKPMEKRVRFPKGKKVKTGDEVIKVAAITVEEGPADLADPRVAAKERAKRRTQLTTELFNEGNRGGEVVYEDNDTFVDDGIQIEPFNLKQEMEEGYFEADGNFVEYVKNENEIKDAWLDSVDTVFTEKSSYIGNMEEDNDDLSSVDVQVTRRRISNVLEPGETVLHALRRLKGTGNGKKDRMPEGTKRIFDQLTEDSMKLIDNGCQDVYHMKREVFDSEADLFKNKEEDFESEADVYGNKIKDVEKEADVLENKRENVESEAGPSVDPADTFDIFGEDDENPTSGHGSEPDIQASSGNLHTIPDCGNEQSDYVYDNSSGYYYSSSSGYYYEPTSGWYCSASSGKWYSFNEQMGTYEEIQGEDQPTVS